MSVETQTHAKVEESQTLRATHREQLVDAIADGVARHLLDVVGVDSLEERRRQLAEPNLEAVRDRVDVVALGERAIVELAFNASALVLVGCEAEDADLQWEKETFISQRSVNCL